MRRIKDIIAVVCLALPLAISCEKNPVKEESELMATVSGTVLDDQENPLEGVTVLFVTADSKKEQKAATTTGNDGKFSVEVPSTGRLVNCTKEGYSSYSTTIPESGFETGEIDLGMIFLDFANASIEGKVFNIEGELYEGVTVKCDGKTSITDSEGIYLFEGLTIKDYTLTFEDNLGNAAELAVSSDDFFDGVAYPKNITLGTELLPGLSYQRFVSAPYWYGNSYAGGYGAFQAQWNNVGFLTAYPIQGENWRHAAEGISLYTSSGHEGQMCSYMYGRKKIYAGNCYVNLCARNFYATASNPAKLSVAVLDLSSGSKDVTYLPSQSIYQGLKKMNGGTSTLDVEHNQFAFDLSAYIGKDIAFAIGVLGGEGYLSGSEVQTPVVRVMFADKDMFEEFESNNLTALFEGEKPESCNWPDFTKSNISSLTPNDGTSFSGKGMGATNAGANAGCDYTPWSGTNHLMMSWAVSIRNEAYTPLKDNLFALNGNRGRNYSEPNNYIFSRFVSPKPEMTVRLRSNNESEPTLLRITVVDLADYSSVALQPTNQNLADQGVVCLGSEANGCLSISHCTGGENEPDKLAELTFDLSAYSGKDVVVVIANHGGADDVGNNHPLSIYSVDFK